MLAVAVFIPASTRFASWSGCRCERRYHPQLAVDEKLNRRQAVAKNNVAHLIEAFTINGHSKPPRCSYAEINFPCVPSASLLNCSQMEPAFFGARRAAGLLQQFRRLSFLMWLRSFASFFVRIIVTTIRKSFSGHTPYTFLPCDLF